MASVGRAQTPRPVKSALSCWAVGAAQAWCPAGVGWEELFVVLKAADTSEAEMLLLLLHSLACGAGATHPAALPDPPPRPGCAQHLLGL